MSRRMWVLAAAAWVVVVIAGSALTWVAISRAGDQVTTSSDVSTAQAGLVSTLGSAPTTVPGHSRTPSSTGPRPTPGVTGTAQPASPAPTHLPTARASTSIPQGSSSPAAHAETRTWTGAAGFVTVSCTGGQARLRGASPSDGWTYEVGASMGESVEVKFERSETEVHVHVTCEGGTPHFQVESGGE